MDLREVNFSGGNFRGAHFNKSWLDRSTFVNADLAGALFYGSRLDGATLAAAKLQWAKFHNANLSKAIFFAPKVSATQADKLRLNPYMEDWYKQIAFFGGNVEALREAKNRDDSGLLEGCDFLGAITDGTSFRATSLVLARNLTTEQIKNAVTDDTTVLPQNLIT